MRSRNLNAETQRAQRHAENNVGKSSLYFDACAYAIGGLGRPFNFIFSACLCALCVSALKSAAYRLIR